MIRRGCPRQHPRATALVPVGGGEKGPEAPAGRQAVTSHPPLPSGSVGFPCGSVRGPARGRTVAVGGEPLPRLHSPVPLQVGEKPDSAAQWGRDSIPQNPARLLLNSSAALRRRLHVDTEINPRRAPQFSAEKLKLADFPLPGLLTALSAGVRRLHGVTPSCGSERS